MSASASPLPTSVFMIHYRGDSFDSTWTVSKNGVAKDLTGATVRSQIRLEDDTLVDTFTVTVTDATAGEITVSLTPTQAQALPVDTELFADIEVTYPSGEVKTISQIFLTVVKDASHD